MSRLALVLVCAVAIGASVGCASTAVPPDHAAQDRAYYNVLAPRLAAYTVADPKLTSDQKARRLRTLAEWAVQSGATATAVPVSAGPGDAQ